MGDALDGRGRRRPAAASTRDITLWTWRAARNVASARLHVGDFPPRTTAGSAGLSTPASPQSLSSTARSDTTAWTVWLLTAPRLMPMAEAIWSSASPQ